MGKRFLKPTIFPDKVVAGFSTRVGGLSRDHLDSLNLSYSVGDDRSAVAANRALLFGEFGFTEADLATAGQVHGTKVISVTQPGFYPECDGLVTGMRGIILCVTAADCASILIADAGRGVAGACHAGWRGAVGGIVPGTIAAMQKLGADVQKMTAYISPCIGVDRFEVGHEVAAQFPDEVVDRSRSRPHVDLKTFLSNTLVDHGIALERQEVSASCTMSEQDMFFSHRGSAGKAGRMMGFIGLTS